MVVTAVYTMTNNNEQRTTNYSKQTQTKPISDYPCFLELAVYNLVLRDGNVMHSTSNSRNFYGENMKCQKHQGLTR